MGQPTAAELQDMVREALGRELSEAEIESYRGRLPTTARCLRIVQDWEARLGDTGPATVYRVPHE